MTDEKDTERTSEPKQSDADRISSNVLSSPSSAEQVDEGPVSPMLSEKEAADQKQQRKQAAESGAAGKKEGQANSIESLDYTADRPIAHEATPSLYDARPGEDSARRRIAYLLIALLFIIIIWILGMTSSGVIDTEELKEFSVILSPVITLVSAATGFYYGTKSK